MTIDVETYLEKRFDYLKKQLEDKKIPRHMIKSTYYAKLYNKYAGSKSPHIRAEVHKNGQVRYRDITNRLNGAPGVWVSAKDDWLP